MAHDASKDRHTAHISERERDEAQERLNAALKAVCANVGPSPVLVGIRDAMTILGMKEA